MIIVYYFVQITGVLKLLEKIVIHNVKLSMPA